MAGFNDLAKSIKFPTSEGCFCYRPDSVCVIWRYIKVWRGHQLHTCYAPLNLQLQQAELSKKYCPPPKHIQCYSSPKHWKYTDNYSFVDGLYIGLSLWIKKKTSPEENCEKKLTAQGGKGEYCQSGKCTEAASTHNSLEKSTQMNPSSLVEPVWNLFPNQLVSPSSTRAQLR